MCHVTLTIDIKPPISEASAGPNTKKEIKLVWTYFKKDDSITKQALQWTPQGHTGRRRPRKTWKRDLKKEMWTPEYKYSWRKMEAGAQDKGGWSQDWSVAYVPPGATRNKSIS